MQCVNLHIASSMSLDIVTARRKGRTLDFIDLFEESLHGHQPALRHNEQSKGKVNVHPKQRITSKYSRRIAGQRGSEHGLTDLCRSALNVGGMTHRFQPLAAAGDCLREEVGVTHEGEVGS